VFIFPGVGLASIVSKTQKITLDMFTTASYALAECVTEDDLAEGSVYPHIRDLKSVSITVAKAILNHIQATDPNSCLRGQDIEHLLAEQMWEPVYLPYRRV